MVVLIEGFGRMGLSHAFQLLGSQGLKSTVHVIDPSIIARSAATVISKRIKIYKSAEEFFNTTGVGVIDRLVIATPPHCRAESTANLRRGSKFSLIEKPVCTDLNNNEMSGYVLQHNPVTRLCGEYLKAKPEVVDCQLETNLNFEEKAFSWRGNLANPLLSEYLGHLLTFAFTPMQAFLRGQTLKVVHLKTFSRNEIELRALIDGIPIHAILLGHRPVRKAQYRVNYLCEGQSVAMDLFTVSVDGVEKASIVDAKLNARYYLRGIDFAMQAERLMHGQGDILPSELIRSIERLID